MIKKSKARKNIRLIQGIFIGLFLLLIGRIIYFNVIEKNKIIINAYNPRMDLLESQVIRGKILGSHGEILAESVQLEDGTYERIYPYGEIFSHIVGFDSYGKSGIEAMTNFHLLSSSESLIKSFWNDVLTQKKVGNQVITTLDTNLQTVAYDALGDYQGAIVAIEPSTGKILAMVSKPDFDPNEIDFLWEELNRDDTNKTFLFNRAILGTYPPGSTFKVITALNYIRTHSNWESFTYHCTGMDYFYGNDISCYGDTAHGDVNLIDALALSCNTAFAHIGTDTDLEQLKALCEKFLFNHELPFDLATSMSQYVLDNNSPLADIPETVIGQGKTEITPLHNALIVATIANGGIMMKPYVVDRIENNEGKIIEKVLPVQYDKIIEAEEAFLMNQLLKTVVEEGTGKGLKDLPFTVAGKTGSAQYSQDGKPHAWFIGYAPADNPQIALSIVVENVGTSSAYAIPIAKQMLSAYLGEEK